MPPPLPCHSGHFHLSHNYSDSISVVGQTAFVQTGVIGESNRDGYRHSRVLKGGCTGASLEQGVSLLAYGRTLKGVCIDVTLEEAGCCPCC